ncbi:hypothetical protein ACFX13_001560 [Malus domestica]
MSHPKVELVKKKPVEQSVFFFDGFEIQRESLGLDTSIYIYTHSERISERFRTSPIGSGEGVRCIFQITC